MFDILVYTDSAEHESLNGRTGFQFVARSAGASPSDEVFAREKLQHIVPTRLDSAGWQEHPETCAYARKGERMYLSRGASTGATIGGRPGNQLTVTAMSSEPLDVLPHRPAQLYASPAWSIARPGSQAAEPWHAPIQIDDDFDVAALHRFVTLDSWCAAALPSVLTMLEQTQAQPRVRLVIKHPDHRTVMRWVALLSRILDAEEALGLEFRVYAEDPVAASAHIIGAHPLLSPELTVERSRQLGVNLLDLEAREHTPVTPTESAIRHAGWFLGHDPYESLDAIETSRRWASAMDPALAAQAAELATIGAGRSVPGVTELRTAAAAIRALVRAGAADEVDTYGDDLADLISSCPPPESDDLEAVDAAIRAVQRAGHAELAQTLTLAALEWAAARPPLARAWAQPATGHLDDDVVVWPDADAREHAASLLASVLSETPQDELPAAFALARRLDTGIAEATVAEHLDRLADLWVHHPEVTDQAARWEHRDAVAQVTADHLTAALTSGDPGVVRSFAAGAWNWLAPTPWSFDPSRLLTAWFAVHELARADADRRAEVLTAMQSAVPASSWPMFLRTSAGLHPQEVAGWVRAHDGVDLGLAAELETIFQRPCGHRAWARGGAIHVIEALATVELRTLPQGLHDHVVRHRAVLPLFTRAAALHDSVPNPALRRLATHGDLGGIYGDWIVGAILDSADLHQALALAHGHARELQERVASALVRSLRNGRADRLAAAARLLDPDLGAWRDVAVRALDAVWDDRQTEQLRAAMLAQVDRYLGDAERGRLEEHLRDQAKGRLSRTVFRGARSLFAAKDAKEASWKK